MGGNAGKITVSQTMKALKTKSSSLYPMQFEKDKNEKYFPHTLCPSTLSSVIKISTGLQERISISCKKSQSDIPSMVTSDRKRNRPGL